MENVFFTTILLFYDLFIIQQKWLKLHIYNNALVMCHWATVCKTVRPMLSDRCHCLSVCRSVMLVGLGLCYGQTVAWIKMLLGMEVGLAPGHTVLDGDTAPTFRHMSVVAKRSPISVTAELFFLQRAQCSHCKRCISYSNSVCPSVCPSVRLSVTRRYCVKTTERSMVQFAPLDNKMCLVL